MAKPLQVPPQGWDKHSIKAELHRQGMTLAKLAELAGMTPNSFSHVWTRPVRKAEKAIAGFLSVNPKQLWPDRYPVSTSRILSSKYAKLQASQKDGAVPDKVAA
jgi:Ner family transcriptional regulator